MVRYMVYIYMVYIYMVRWTVQPGRVHTGFCGLRLASSKHLRCIRRFRFPPFPPRGGGALFSVIVFEQSMRSLCPKLIVKSLLGTSTDVVLEAPYYVTSDLRARRARRSDACSQHFFANVLRGSKVDQSIIPDLRKIPKTTLNQKSDISGSFWDFSQNWYYRLV